VPGAGSHKPGPTGSAFEAQIKYVCNNLYFSGEVCLARKYTAFIDRDLPGLVSKAVGKLTEQRGRQERGSSPTRPT
jgi:hypothetical protein